MLGKFPHMPALYAITRAEKWLLLAVSIVFTIVVARVFYPGFMSFDTIHALTGARTQVTDSMWPPMVSYVWMVVDLISPNPSAMHMAQLLLLFGSFFTITFIFTRSWAATLIAGVLYLGVPVILGTVSVIWKDVLMAAFLLGAATTSFLAQSTKTRFARAWLYITGLVLAFLGVCTRHNAITAGVPILFYFSWIGLPVSGRSRFADWARRLGLGLLLTACVFVPKLVLDNYSLPYFKRIAGIDDLMPAVRAMDIAGASLCVKESLFADVVPDLTLQEIRDGYDPRHVNLSKKLLDRLSLNTDRGIGQVNLLWFAVALRHPICFLDNRVELTKFMIGANKGDQFLITSPEINENPYGYKLRPSVVRNMSVDYLVTQSNAFYVRPWFIYGLALASLALLAASGGVPSGLWMLCVSAIFYFGGLVLFGNAADARLLFYTNTVMLLLTFVAIARVIQAFGQRRLETAQTVSVE